MVADIAGESTTSDYNRHLCSVGTECIVGTVDHFGTNSTSPVFDLYDPPLPMTMAQHVSTAIVRLSNQPHAIETLMNEQPSHGSFEGLPR